MSMLAERKTKQKWSLNPRGKAWSEDSNKFGQKMLEKMGWSRGKGLGAKENGITEHVKISYKNDSKGMGFKESSEQWTEHDTNFNALLESLAGGDAHPPPPPKISASLELKSQNSRARVHYRKFTRGKDLSRASDKDLANIFGKKSLADPPLFTPAPVPPPQREENALIHPKNEALYSNGGSMLDYFKKKLPNFGKHNGYEVGSNGVLKKSSCDASNDGEEHDEPAFAGFGFTNKRKSSEDHIEITPKKFKLEERKDSPFKKKKNQDNSLGLANPAFEPMSTKVPLEKHELNPIAEEDSLNTSENKPKKKKKRTETIDEEQVDTVEEVNSSAYEIKRKKKKKREQNLENGISNENFSDSLQETSTSSDLYEVKRKKKKKHRRAVEEDNCNLANSIESNGINNENFLEQDEDVGSPSTNCDYEVKRCSSSSSSKKKKKKKLKQPDLAIDNPNFDLSANDSSNQSGYVNDEFEVKRSTASNSPELLSNSVNFEVKRKKTKRIETNMIVQAHTNQNFQLDDDDDTATASASPSLFNNSYEVKRKKVPITNCGDSAAEADNFAFDLMLNVTSTPAVAKPPASTSLTGSSSVKRRKSVRFSNVTQERIIPNNEDIRERNELFDINTFVIENGLKANIDENCQAISKKFDGFQAEIENDLNEAKAGFIGDVSTPHGENEKLASGSCKLKFKYANFNASNSFWMMKNKQASHSRSSYKHLIKGDIVLGFNNTNLHQIEGYATTANKTV